MGVDGAPVDRLPGLGDHAGRFFGVAGLLGDQLDGEEVDLGRPAGGDHQAELPPGRLAFPPVGPVGAQEIAVRRAVVDQIDHLAAVQEGLILVEPVAMARPQVEGGGQCLRRSGGTGSDGEHGPVLAVPPRQVDVDPAAEPPAHAVRLDQRDLQRAVLLEGGGRLQRRQQRHDGLPRRLWSLK